MPVALSSPCQIERFTRLDDARLLGQLASLLCDAVQHGASIGFLQPLGHEAAATYWQGVAAAVADGEVWIWLALVGEQLVGTVQLAPALRANGRNRAEVQKLMVHSAARRQGIAGRLMAALEAEARQQQRHLLFLDTEAGSPAETLYRQLGYQRVGEIPDYANSPDGTLHPTAIYFKQLDDTARHAVAGRPLARAQIRLAQAEDAAAIVAIYNPYIAETTISFEEAPVDAGEMRERMEKVQSAELPWLVAELDGQIVGYAYATPWRVRRAYRFAVESSVYLAPSATGQGIGRALYTELLIRLQQAGMHTVIGGIALPNVGSIALHESLGFHRVAQFEEVGYKFGRRLDVGYWQRRL